MMKPARLERGRIEFSEPSFQLLPPSQPANYRTSLLVFTQALPQGGTDLMGPRHE